MANQAQTPSQVPAQETKYFDLHTTGIGYLNRVRWVEINKGGRKAKPFLACSINALRGSSEEIENTYFDLKVSGEDSIKRIESLRPYVEERRRVLVRFCIGDIYPHLYERNARDQNGQPTGGKEWTSLIKGRLIRLDSVKLDGKLIWKREKDSQGQAGGDAPSAPAQAVNQQSAPKPRPQPAAASPVDKPAPASRADTQEAVMSQADYDDDIPF